MSRILVAEDARLVRVILTRSLAPHEIIEAGDGEQALALLREHRPEIAILDWAMPGLTGIEVCEVARADPDFQQMWIVMLTARTDYNAERVAREAGADHFVRKPIMPNQILMLVNRLLRSPRPAPKSR